MHVMPQPQECQRARWYTECTWTWGDDWEELVYITYE